MHADAFVGPCYIFTERYVSVGVVYATFRAVMSFGRLLTLLFRCTKFGLCCTAYYFRRHGWP